MAIKRYQQLMVIDAESDRNSSWPEGTAVFCLDTDRNYVMKGGNWVHVGATAVADVLDGLQKITVSATEPTSPSTGDLWVDIS